MQMPLSDISDLASTLPLWFKESEIYSLKSYRDDAKAVKWTCDGSPEFTIEEIEKADRGSDIILYIDDDCKEFLEEARISELLKKYSKLLLSYCIWKKKMERRQTGRNGCKII